MVKNMKKSTLGYIILGLVVLVVVSVVGGTGYCWVYGGGTCTSNMTNLIYSLTLAAVVFYTLETIKLREEAQKANITATRSVVVPYPVVEVEETEPVVKTKSQGESPKTEFYFYLKNVMKDRVAFNVCFLVKNGTSFKISKLDAIPRIMVFEDSFKCTDDMFDTFDSSNSSDIVEVKKCLPKNASKVVDTMIQQDRLALCCIHSDIDQNMGHYIILYGIKQGEVMRGGPGTVETGSFYYEEKKHWYKFW